MRWKIIRHTHFTQKPGLDFIQGVPGFAWKSPYAHLTFRSCCSATDSIPIQCWKQIRKTIDMYCINLSIHLNESLFYYCHFYITAFILNNGTQLYRIWRHFSIVFTVNTKLLKKLLVKYCVSFIHAVMWP